MIEIISMLAYIIFSNPLNKFAAKANIGYIPIFSHIKDLQPHIGLSWKFFGAQTIYTLVFYLIFLSSL